MLWNIRRAVEKIGIKHNLAPALENGTPADKLISFLDGNEAPGPKMNFPVYRGEACLVLEVPTER